MRVHWARSFASNGLAWLLAMGFVALLAACGGGDDDTPSRPQAVLEPSNAVTAVIGRAGGTLTATASDGTTYELTIPADALPGPITITMTPVAGIDGLPLSGGLAGAVDLQPSGTVLARTAVLTITSARTAPAGLILTGFGIDEGAAAARRAWALQSGGVTRVGLTGFSTHGAGYGTLQDLQQLDSEAGRTQTEDAALTAARDVLASAATTADEKFDAYLAYYDEVVEPMIRRAGSDVELVAAILEYAQWATQAYSLWTGSNPSIQATWDPWYFGDNRLGDEAILERQTLWFGLAGPKLRQAFDANNALCASQKSLGALRNTLFYVAQIQGLLSPAAQSANGIDPASIQDRLCARLVISSLTLADPLQTTVPSDLDVTFGLVFGQDTEAQAAPVQVEFSGVNAAFGTTSPANGNVQGQFTLAVSAQAAGSPVTVFLKGCLAFGLEFGGVDIEPLICIEEVVQRSTPPGSGVSTVLPPEGFTSIKARDMNASGHVVGLMSGSQGAGGAFVWRGGAPTLLPNLSCNPADLALFGSDAFGINGRGDIVGLSCGVPVLWPGGGAPVDLAATAAGVGWVLQTAEFINDRGQIVGRGVNNGVGAFYFLDTDNSITRITGVGSVLDLSEDGDVVGWLPTGGMGYLWRRGETRIDIQGNVFSVNSVNSGRVVTGNTSQSTTRGVTWGAPYTSADRTDIASPVSGYTTFPQHIGDDGSVVGFFTGPDPGGGRDFIKAFHWKDGRFTDLSATHGAGTVQQSAIRVGEGGYVLLDSIRTTPQGNQDFFMVVPRP